MKVVQILIDGFHPDYTQKELLDLNHVSQLYSGYVKIDSKFPRLKRLNSPYMWGRTLAGPEFPRTLNPPHQIPNRIFKDLAFFKWDEIA